MFSDRALSQRFHFLEPYPAIALTVSGGADSLALLHLIARWKKNIEASDSEAHQKMRHPKGRHSVADLKIHVLSVDHGLRPQAQEECAFVMDEAQKRGFLGQVLRWEGEKPRSGIQEAARKARYELFAAYCARHTIPILLTAHQLEDQAETFLMRLARGGGVDSLSAIAAQSAQHGLKIARPLLDVPKQDLKDYLKSLDKVWVEDPSNQNTDYERVAIRKNLSALQAMNVPLICVGRSAARLGRARQALDQMAERLYVTKVAFSTLPVFFFEAGLLKSEPEELIIRLFRLIFEKMSFSQAAPELKQVETMLDGFLQGDFNKTTLSGCGVQLTGQGVYIYREVGRIFADEAQNPAPPNRWIKWDNRFEVMVKGHYDQPIFLRPVGTQAFARFRKSLQKRLDLPHYLRLMPASVGSSMLSFWQDKTVVAIPDLDYYDCGITQEDIAVRPLILDRKGRNSFS